MNCVTYTQFFEDGDVMKREKTACFSELYPNWVFRNQHKKILTRITYDAVIDSKHGKLKIEQVKVYLEFLKTMLDGKRFTYKVDEKEKIVKFTFKCRGLRKNIQLLYLTAFRYIDEMPYIVSALCEKCLDNLDAEGLFQEFQKIHFKSSSLLNGHTLIYKYGGNYKAITHKDFLENLENENITNVNGCFDKWEKPEKTDLT